jgi:hypothetical protein
VAELRYESALAKLEMAYANVLAAIGEDPFPTDTSGDGVAELAEALQKRWEWLERPEVLAPVDQPATQPQETDIQPQETNTQPQGTEPHPQKTVAQTQGTDTQPQERPNP